jgi:hypothetical protein
MGEGNLPAARKRLAEAVGRLCEPQVRQIEGRMVTAPSLYGQLSDAAPRSQGQSKVPAKSLPPIWIDAVQLLTLIDKQVRQWCRRPADVSTPARLRALSDRPWRPQDTTLVSEIANVVMGWAVRIEDLLDPEAVKHISAACPSCGARTVHRRDSGGDLVRVPALQLVTSQGCTCGRCDAHWAPDRYLFLCRLLGFELPAGVLE